MSDEWIAATVTRIKQSEEDKRQKEKYALLREQKFYSNEDKLFEELQTILKATIAKLNEQLPEKPKRFDIKTRYDEIELVGPNELSFDIKQDSKGHELTLAPGKETAERRVMRKQYRLISIKMKKFVTCGKAGRRVSDN